MIRKRTGDSSNLIAPYSFGGKPMSVWPIPGIGFGSYGYGMIKDKDDTVFQYIGTSTGAVNGTASAPGALTGATRNYIQWQSAAATNGQVSGPAWSSANEMRGNAGFWSAFVWRCAETTALRAWFGCSTGGLQGVVVPTASAAAGTAYAAIGFDPAISANFIAASGDGVNNSGTSMGLAPVTQHEYSLIVDHLSEYGVAVNYYIYDLTLGTLAAQTRKTTNLPATTATLGYAWHSTITTLENVVKNLQLNSFAVGSRF